MSFMLVVFCYLLLVTRNAAVLCLPLIFKEKTSLLYILDTVYSVIYLNQFYSLITTQEVKAL